MYILFVLYKGKAYKIGARDINEVNFLRWGIEDGLNPGRVFAIFES